VVKRSSRRTILEVRQKQFGFYEAIMVGAGAVLIAIGCGLYLIGLFMAEH
jgi:hypothetical protein